LIQRRNAELYGRPDMMKTGIITLLFLVLMVAIAIAQTAAPSSKPTQADIRAIDAFVRRAFDVGATPGLGVAGVAHGQKALSDNFMALKGDEMGMAEETTAAGRAERERSIQRLKAEVEELTQKEQQEQGFETQLSAQLQLEQIKLNELSERLDTLQRELETQLSTDKLQPSGKRP